MIHLMGAPNVGEELRSLSLKCADNAPQCARSFGNGVQWLYKVVGVCRLAAEGMLTAALYHDDMMP